MVLAVAVHASAAAAQPASERAAQHNVRGVKLLVEPPRDIAAAELEFAAAYRLDPNPMFMFNLALAQRLGGKCREAIESYRAYLRTEPPEVNAANARIGIERCEQILASQERSTPPAADRQPIAKAIDTPRQSPHWGGTVLLATGGVSAIASVTLYVLARRAGTSTFEAGSLDEHERRQDRAATLQSASWITAGAAGLMAAAGGVILVATRRSARPIGVGVQPKQSGAALVIGGRF